MALSGLQLQQVNPTPTQQKDNSNHSSIRLHVSYAHQRWMYTTMLETFRMLLTPLLEEGRNAWTEWMETPRDLSHVESVDLGLS